MLTLRFDTGDNWALYSRMFAENMKKDVFLTLFYAFPDVLHERKVPVFRDFLTSQGNPGNPGFHSFLGKPGKRPISPVVSLFRQKVKPRFQAFSGFFPRWPTGTHFLMVRH